MRTPVQAGELELVALERMAGQKRPGLPPQGRTAAVTLGFPAQAAV